MKEIKEIIQDFKENAINDGQQFRVFWNLFNELYHQCKGNEFLPEEIVWNDPIEFYSDMKEVLDSLIKNCEEVKAENIEEYEEDYK
jgi:hypothetical protein